MQMVSFLHLPKPETIDMITYILHLIEMNHVIHGIFIIFIRLTVYNKSVTSKQCERAVNVWNIFQPPKLQKMGYLRKAGTKALRGELHTGLCSL